MGMIKLLEKDKKIARLDAYSLASMAMDCRVGAVRHREERPLPDAQKHLGAK